MYDFSLKNGAHLQTASLFICLYIYRGQLDGCTQDAGGSPKRQVSPPLETRGKYAIGEEGQSFATRHVWKLRISIYQWPYAQEGSTLPQGIELVWPVFL